MDKGIRPYAKNLFATENAKRVNGEFGTDMKKANTAFRKHCIAVLMSEFGITLASAATHYNTAFIDYKTANPTLVEGLGRPEDKKGGRKSNAEKAAMARDALVFAPFETREQHIARMQAETAAIPSGTLLSEGVKENTSVQTVTVNEAAPVEQTVFKVCKKSDGTVVAEGLSFEDAKALVEKAAAAKKAKLYWV